MTQTADIDQGVDNSPCLLLGVHAVPPRERIPNGLDHRFVLIAPTFSVHSDTRGLTARHGSMSPGHEITHDLPNWPDPTTCATIGGLDLGEVTLGVYVGGDEQVELHQAVGHLGFRKPFRTSGVGGSLEVGTAGGTRALVR
jgi:hypothetical protein